MLQKESPSALRYLAVERQRIFRGSEVVLGTIQRFGTGFGGGDRYLRNGTSEPLNKSGRFSSLSPTLWGPCPGLGAFSIRLIFCHPSMGLELREDRA